jgi:hypothetical protein
MMSSDSSIEIEIIVYTVIMEKILALALNGVASTVAAIAGVALCCFLLFFIYSGQYMRYDYSTMFRPVKVGLVNRFYGAFR